MDKSRQGEISRILVKSFVRDNGVRFLNKNLEDSQKKKAKELGITYEELREYLKLIAHEVIEEAL